MNTEYELVFGSENILKETFVKPRNIICKGCSFQFKSIDVKCFEHSDRRAKVFCPRCKIENVILKEVTWPSNE